jgi:hypothetical protein
MQGADGPKCSTLRLHRHDHPYWVLMAVTAVTMACDNVIPLQDTRG